MDHIMVLSYDYSNWNRRRRRTNAPPPRAISMAMAVRRWEAARIDQWRRSRAFIKATKRHHWVTTRSVSPRRPPGQQQTKQQFKISTPLLNFSMAIAMRRYYTVPIAQWRMFLAFIKVTKRHQQVSTCSNIIKGTRQRRMFLRFHREKGLELTCWPLITIGVWHTKLIRRT